MTTNLVPKVATSGFGGLAAGAAAADVPFTNAGTGLVATDAQAALAELDAKKEALGKIAGIDVQAGNAYTFALADQGKLVETTAGTAVSLTIPANATIAFPINAEIRVLQYGAGVVSFVAAGGVTLRSPGAYAKIATRYGQAVLTKIAADEWALAGALGP